MGFREVALEGSGLDLLERQTGEELPVSAERVTVHGQHGAAVLLDSAPE